MKLYFTMLVVTLCSTLALKAQISGTVFKDFDNDGFFDNTATSFPFEKGAPNVTVNVYTAANVLLATTITSATGTYTFSAVSVPPNSYRVEFVTPSGIHNGTGSNILAASSNTDVQFITAPATNVNYGLASSDWYVTNNNPFIATNVLSAGNPTGGGTSGTRDNLFVLPYSLPTTGTVGVFDPAQAQREAQSTIGSVFGLAYQKSTNTLLLSAYYKRHVGFGPNGIGAIYKTQVTAGNPAVPDLLINVSTIGINVGTDTRSNTPGDPNYISPASNAISQDQAAFANIGKRGIGDIDLSEDGKDLYLVNLFQNKLHRVNIGSPIKSTITSGDVTEWIIPNPTGIGSLTWHPFGLKAANGKVYVGGVMVKEQTTNHNLATDTVGQRGVVYEFNPTTGAFTEVLRFPLTYRRGYSNAEVRFPTRNNYWCAWQNNGDGSATGPLQAGYNDIGGSTPFNGGIYYPQPMLADIEFTDDNQMLIGMRDRFGDQMGYQQPDINGFPATGFPVTAPVAAVKFRGLNSGDNLIAGKNLTGTGWTMESRGQVTNYGVTAGILDGVYPTGTPVTTNTASWTGNSGSPFGIGNGTTTSGAFGPGSGFGTSTYTPAGGPAPGNNQGGYYLNNHNFTNNAANTGEDGLGNAVALNGTGVGINAHFVKGDGGLAVVHGTNEYIFTLMDPANNTFTSGLERMVVNTNGAATHGNMVQRLELTSFISNDPSNMGKANAMGDVEVLTPYQPIEIGNRIWTDANGNGVQDAGATEAGINGITVQLVSPGPDGIFGNGNDVVVATTTTTTIAGQPGSYFFNTLSTADARKPASLIGVGANDILPGFDYQVRVASGQAPLTGLQLTRSNTAANTVDNIDNDAIMSGTNAVATFNTSNTNHSYDFGFKALASLGDRVWLDNGVGSGTANDGLQNGTEPGVAGVTVTLYASDGTTVVATTVTDAYGNYLFDNLTPATYVVGFTLPTNYQFTTNTNTTDDGNTTGSGATAASQNGSDANATTGKTYGVVLSAGENNRNIDAGLIFNTPTLPNSIGDRVWLDTDGNGLQNGTEPGVAGVTVTLYASDGVTVLATTVTDANGNYIFTGLPANTNYVVGFTPPAGMVFTTKDQTAGGGTDTNDSDVNTTGINFGKTDIVNSGVVPGTQVTSVDAGIRPQTAGNASLGDKVWNDLNNNGTQDAGEPGIAGVTVNLYQDANGDGVLTGGELTPYTTTVTDAFGNYIFNNLPVTGGPVDGNKWQVEFVQPGGYNNTAIANNNSGNDATDSDITNNATDRTGFIRLKVDERNMNVDAGFVSTAPGTLKLGDKVWKDQDADGQQDANEPGVPGVTVKLYQNGTDGLPGTSDDVLVKIAYTDVNGNYVFTNLAASTGATSNYNVQFENIPSGYSFTTQDAGADASDNDANNIGRTGSINLTADNLTIDAGIVQGTPSGMGSLGDKVWYDLNNDGVQDAGELGAAGVTVNLYNDANNDGIISGAELTPVATETTNALGEYLFDNLNGGSYQVGFTLPSNLSTYTLSTKDAAAATDATDSDGNPKNTSVSGNTAGAQTSYTSLIPLAQGEDKLTVDLGIVPPSNTNTLGGTAWYDANSDGTQDDPGRIPGVMVTLYNSAGVAIATTTTDENGDYLFVGLANGDYSVGFSNYPAGFEPTTKSGANDAIGSDADRINGTTPTVTLNGSNRNDRSLDVGLISTRAALGNKVWDDLNGDGIQDANEPGVPGVTVILYAADGTTVISSTITDQNGNYLFANLNAGTYIVGFGTLPNGKEFTQQNTAGDNQNNTNSDAAPSGANIGKTSQIVLSAGEVDLTVDAGIRSTPVATVGNRVWDDLNSNGIQDAGEPGIPGVIATLYNSANQPIGSAVTGANGEWLITNVPVGTGYYVIFTNKPAGSWTVQDNGGSGTGGGTDTDTDSDVNPSGQTGIFNVVAGDYKIVIDAGITMTFTLPIPYESFTATKINSTSVLQFNIGRSATGTVFNIERSIDGVQFTSIGVMNGSAATTYNYTDMQPVQNARNYYRIKDADAQGRVSYSEVRMVRFTKDGKIDIYPIPAASNLSITLGDEVINKPIVITLYNNQGQELMRKQISRATATEVIDVTNYANGTYRLRITSNNVVIANKQVVIMK